MRPEKCSSDGDFSSLTSIEGEVPNPEETLSLHWILAFAETCSG